MLFRTLPQPRSLLCRLATIGLVAASAGAVVHAQDPDHAQHLAAVAACDVCPSPRESSGTSWQPDAAGMSHPLRQVGTWFVGTHLQVTAMAINETGTRGDDAIVAPSHGMFNARRRVGAGTFAVRTMWSPDPLMGAEGYPLLTQTGESVDGVNPLVDRQHPHDFFMELAAAYERPLRSGATLSLYLAAVGEPAFGPPAFMHRPSSELLPIAPITHHWFDSTHITQGVFTVGLAPSRRLRFELSAFRGREPDAKRWGLELPRFDSFSLRVSVNPTPSLALQASAGVLNNAESVHRDADITRLTASAMYARRWDGGSIAALAAVAHATRTASLLPVEGGFYYSPGATSPAAILEATVGLRDRHELVMRAEAVQKDELFGITDPRHTSLFPVARSTFGYAFRALSLPNAAVRVGAAWSATRVAGDIRPDYGGNQTGYLGFVRLDLH